MNKWMEEQYEALGISREVYEFGEKIEDSLKERFAAIDATAEYNQLKVIKAMQTPDGNSWWAAFTSFEEELKGSGSVMSTFLTGIEQAFRAVLAAEGAKGIIVNPWNRTIMLDKNLIRIILGEPA